MRAHSSILTHFRARFMRHALAVTCIGLLAAACGGDPVQRATPSAEPTQTPAQATPEPTATATATGPAAAPLDPAATGAWRTDLPTGGQEGDRAHATPVLLRDGTTATFEEIADGDPLLLYFFATW